MMTSLGNSLPASSTLALLIFNSSLYFQLTLAHCLLLLLYLADFARPKLYGRISEGAGLQTLLPNTN